MQLKFQKLSREDHNKLIGNSKGPTEIQFLVKIQNITIKKYIKKIIQDIKRDKLDIIMQALMKFVFPSVCQKKTKHKCN